MGNYHATFCRAVGKATCLLTLIKYYIKAISDYSQAITSLKNAISTYSDNDYTSPVGISLGDKLAKVYLQRAELYRPTSC